jgi:hypothetical protein
MVIWRGRGTEGIQGRGRCSPHNPTLRVSLSFVGERGSKTHEGTTERQASFSRQDLGSPGQEEAAGNQKPKTKRKGERQRHDSFFVFNHFQVKGKKGASWRKVVQRSFSPSAPAAASQAPKPGSHECERSRAAKDRVRSGDGKKEVSVRNASCLWGYATFESQSSRAASLPPGKSSREGQEVVGTYPEGITCTSILYSSMLAPRASPQPAPAAPATQGCHPPPPNLRVPGDPFPPGRMPALHSHLVGRGGSGGPGGGAGSAPGRGERPQQRWAAARVPAGNRRAPAEAMRATLSGLVGSVVGCAPFSRKEGSLEEPPGGLVLGATGRRGGVGRRGAAAALSLLAPGRPGSLELKP